jgi:phytoene dehydrogenase-like protein
VKINLALDRLPVFPSHPRFDPQVHGGTIVLAESLDDLETAFQEAASGRPSGLPFADICIPSVFDDSLARSGHHVMSMFTSWEGGRGRRRVTRRERRARGPRRSR